jgi:hypothetical protein
MAAVTSITGVSSETGATVGSVTLNTTHTNAGTYASDSWSFTGAANYNNISSTTITDSIAKANAVIVVTPYTSPTTTYDGLAHTATITSITGVNGETGATVGAVTLSTTHTNASTYASDTWSFTGAPTTSSSFESPTASPRRPPSDHGHALHRPAMTYDGNAHTATGNATGVNNVDLSSG